MPLSDVETRPRCPNPACGNADLQTVLEREDPFAGGGVHGRFAYRLAHCAVCGLAFVDPRPAPEILAGFYRPDYAYHAPSGDASSVVENVKRAIAPLRYRQDLAGGGVAAFAGKALASAVEAVSNHSISYTLAIPLALPRDACLLDYGFGSGAWLLAMQRRGHSCLFGFDIPQNRTNCERLAARGIRTTCGDPCAEFPSGRFDLIRLEHVFEHLLDPIGELQRLRTLLRPGGYLVMTFPSIEPWEPMQELARSPHLDHLQLPIHLFHHSQASARDFAASAGFRNVRVRRLKPFGYLSLLAEASDDAAAATPSARRGPSGETTSTDAPERAENGAR